MTPQQILLKAAKRVDSGRDIYSCIAVKEVCPPRSRLLRFEFARLASPVPGTELCTVDIYDAIHSFNNSVEAKEFRVLLLLMIRAAYKDIKEKKKCRRSLT